MNSNSRPILPLKPSDLTAPRPGIPRPPPIRRSSSAASARPPAPPAAPPPVGGSDGELEQMRRTSYPGGGLIAPGLPHTPQTVRGGGIIPVNTEVNLNNQQNQFGELGQEKGNRGTNNNLQSNTRSTNDLSMKRSGASRHTHTIKNISIQAKFSFNRPFDYKPMDSPNDRGSNLPRRHDPGTPTRALAEKKSAPPKPNFSKPPKLPAATHTQSSPLETTRNTTPKIISATLKNGQQISFTSPRRGSDSVDGGFQAPSSNRTPDSPRSRGRRSNANRLIIKTPLHSADTKYARPPCPFSPIDKVDPKCKQLTDGLACGASPERRERRDSVQSEQEQQIQELNSFVSLSSTSTPLTGTAASRDNLVDAVDDESQEEFRRTTPKQNSEMTEGVKRMSSIRGPIDKMRDSLKKALSNPCASAGLESNSSWHQLPNPSPERKASPPPIVANEKSCAPAPEVFCDRITKNDCKQTLAAMFEDTTTTLADTAPEASGILHRLWGAITDAIRKAWQRLRAAVIRLFYPQHKK